MNASRTLKYLQVRTPQVFENVARDLMNIIGENVVAGPAGGRIKTASPIVYRNVPVECVPVLKHEGHDTINAKMLSQARYTLSFAMHFNNRRIVIDPTSHRFQVLANKLSGEPERIFRLVSVREMSGVNFEVECTKEN